MSNGSKSSSLYDYEVKDIIGNDVSLSRYKGKVVLIVNVASKCGFTNQYADLQALYEEYQDEDFVILGFPANNFLNQEPGSNEEINRFCTSKFGVTFPMFSKISVKGKDKHPLYEYLTSKKLNGRKNAPVNWNFQKYLVDRKGKVRHVFQPMERVKNKKIQRLIRQQVRGV
jgi:glutathione peroxidase